MNIDKENEKKDLSFNMEKDINIPYNEITNASTIDRAKAPEEILPLLITEVAEKLKITKGVAKALIFGNLHSGGTASKASPNHTFHFKYQNTDLFLDLRTLKLLTEKIEKKINQKFTLRQLARTHETEILDFAIRLNILGNLSKKFLQINPNLENQEIIFASDYVNPSNPSIPKEIQRLLIEHKNQSIQ